MVLRLVLGLVLVAVPLVASEPAPQPGLEHNLEEIVRRHVEAKGGAEAIAAVTSLRIRGNYTAFGDAAPFELVKARPQLYRFDHRALGSDVTYAFDGTEAWWINSAMGYEWAVAPPLPERRFIFSESLFDDPLIDAASRGITLRAGGAGDLDGSPTVTVVATLPDGAEETWHLDPATWLEVKRESVGADYGRALGCTTYYSDFRRVEGVMYPFRVEQEYSIRWRVFEVSGIEVNPKLEAATFRLPLEPELAALAGLGGRWDVTVESIAYPTAPKHESTTTSSIVERFGGRVFQEEISLVTATAAFNETRLLSWDRFRDRWTLVVHDDTSAFANVLFGVPREDGVLVFDNLTSGTSLVLGDQTYHSRYTLNRTGPDELTLTVEGSSDAGATWTPVYSSVYRRATG